MRLLSFILLFGTLTVQSQTKVSIGTNQDSLKKVYGELKKMIFPSENTVVYTRMENLYGIKGEWGYRYQNDSLNWIHFDKYTDTLTDANFKKCLEATQKIIAAYTKAFGKPDEIKKGNTKFIDPVKTHHWGYDVLEARWKNYKGMKISVEFTFMGGKGEYHFLVKINYFDKDYPYYD